MDGATWDALARLAEQWLGVWSALSVKASLALVAAALASLALRRGSAAARHLVWTLGVAAVVALPLASVALPRWDVEAWPAVAPPPVLTEPARSAQRAPRRAPPSFSPAPDSPLRSLPPARSEPALAVPLLLLWLAGVVALGAGYLGGALRLRALIRRSRIVADGPWRELADAAADRLGVRRERFRLYAASEPTSPLAWGAVRVAIVLPPSFSEWSPGRRRHVLLHELAHVKRHDCASQWLASAAATLHWFNPLAWLAARRMLAERERACDDEVLLAGTRASAYADDLLQIARGATGAAATLRVSAAMARRSEVAARLRAVLDPARRRGGVRRRTLGATAAVALALAAPLAAVTAAQEEPSGGVVEGRVVGPDGAAVEGAEVRLRGLDGGRGGAPAVTDAAGVFRLTSDDPGPYVLGVWHGDFAPRVVERVPAGVESLEVTLEPGLVIEGRVLDATRGTPIADGAVRAVPTGLRWGGTELAREGRSDAEGRFRLEHLPAGAHLVSARGAGYARVERRDVPAGAAVELVMIPGSSIDGVVVDVEGRPVAGARVRALEGLVPSQSAVLEAAAPTGADGGFQVAGVEPGRYRLEVRCAGYAPLVSDPVRVEAELPARVTLELEAGALVTGRLLTAEGDPTPGRVELRESGDVALSEERVAESRVEAGPEGGFRLGPLASGEHRLIASADHHVPILLEVRVAPGETEVDLGEVRLEAGAWIRGRVVDTDGRPLEGAAVSASSSGSIDARARSGPDGAFELTGLPRVAHRLSAAAPGYVQRYPLSAPVEAGTADVVLELTRAGTVTGRVEDPEGRPVTAFGVQLEGEERSSGPTYYGPARPFGDAEGRFRLEDVAPGAHVLEVTAAGYRREVVTDVGVSAGEVTDVGAVRLDRGATLAGTVVDEAGAAVPGATLRLQPAARDSYWAGQETRSGIGGAYRLEGLGAGRVDLLVRHRDYAEQRVEGIEIPAGRSEVALDVVLVRGGRIEGRVLRRDGRPLAGVPVTFTVEGAGSMGMSTLIENMTSTGPDGRFAFESVRPGRTRVHVFARSGSTFEGVTNTTVAVRPGETASVDLLLSEILVRGQVTRGGAPAPDVMVRARNRNVSVVRIMTSGGGPLPGTVPRRLVGTTDVSGRYELLLDGPGSHEFLVLPASGSGRLASREVEVPDAPVHVVDLELPAGAVAGTVVDGETGAPLADARAELRPAPEGAMPVLVTTDTAGRFRLFAEPGQQRVVVSLPGYAPVEREVRVREGLATELEIALERGLELRGRVVDAAGRGVGGVGVVAVADAEEQRLASRARTLGDGSFVLAGLEERSYALAAGADAAGFAIHPGAAPDREAALVLTLRPAARLSVRVVDAGGEPVAGATVTLDRVNGHWFAQGRGWIDGSDEAGVAELRVPGGRLALVASHPDGRRGFLTLDVADGATAEREIVLDEAPASR